MTNPEVEQLRYRAVILELLSAAGPDVANVSRETHSPEPHLHVATDDDAEADAIDEAFVAERIAEEAENGVLPLEDDEVEGDVEVEAYMASLMAGEMFDEDEPDEEPEITRRIRVKIHAPGVE